jgi:PDZ domain-containing protein
VTYHSDFESEERGRGMGRGWITWLVAAVLIGTVLVLAGLPTDKVIEIPGPVYDTLGTVEVDNETVPLIDIPMAETFPTTGSLDMLTVRTIGNREEPAKWYQVIEAWLDPSQAVVKLNDIYPKGQSTEESIELGQAQMKESQQEAIAAAMNVLGEDYTTQVSVIGTTEGSAAEGILEPDDVILNVNGVAVESAAEVRGQLAENGTELPANITIVRDGETQVVQVTPRSGDDPSSPPLIGIQITTTYTFPYDVTVQLENVGGPSAGQVFALAIIDKLSPGPLTGGLDFAGTGTIQPDGTISAIGGIRQKMYGAQREGADYFLAPASNCDEVVDHIPAGLTVFAVANLSDSIAVLNTLSAGGSTDLLPRCMAG